MLQASWTRPLRERESSHLPSHGVGAAGTVRVMVAHKLISQAGPGCETPAPSHCQAGLEQQEKLKSLSVMSKITTCEGPMQQGVASSHGGKRPWLQGASDQLPLGHITVRTQPGDLLTAHST